MSTAREPINLGILTHDFYPFVGGLGRYIYDIYYKGFIGQEGMNVKFISACRNKLRGNLEIFHFTKYFGKHILFSIFVNCVLDIFIRKHKFNILNVFSGPGGVFLLRKPRGVKLIVTACHTYYQQSQVKREKWKRVFIPLERRTLRLADKIIAISPSTKKVLVDYYGLDVQGVEIVTPCVDTEKFYPLRNTDKIEKSLLFVGRLEIRKGIDFLVRVMSKVVEKDKDIKLYIMGDGVLKPWIEEFTEKHGIKENVKLLGFVPELRINEWYNKVQAVVVPSVFEGFGITAIEAMACRVPIIAVNTEGLCDVVKDRKTGVLVDRKIGPFADQIIRVLNNREMIDEMGEAAYWEVIHKYACRNKTNELIRIITL